jgi:hypothetical protein
VLCRVVERPHESLLKSFDSASSFDLMNKDQYGSPVLEAVNRGLAIPFLDLYINSGENEEN